MSFSLYSVSGKDFIGRDKIIDELVKELSSKNKIGYSLSGIRRIGKTSILKETQNQLEKKGIVVINVSIWRVVPSTVDEFSKILNRATISAFQNKLPKKFKFDQLLATGASALKTFLQNLKLSTPVVSDLEVSVSYVRKESDNVEDVINKTFSLIDDLTQMTKTQSVLILDEFPSIMDLTYGKKNQKTGQGIVQLLRTLFEDYKQTKLVVSGSYRDTLNNLVSKSKAPFYKQLLLREIQPFTEKEHDKFLKHYLPNVKFDDGIKSLMYTITSGIPYNLQLVGKEIQHLELINIDANKLNKVISSVLEKEGGQVFKEFIENLSPTEIKVLKGLAKNPNSSPKKISEAEFIDESSTNNAINQLKTNAILQKVGRGEYEFTDNLFSEWLKYQDCL